MSGTSSSRRKRNKRSPIREGGLAMATTMTMNGAGIAEKVAEARASFRGGRIRPASWLCAARGLEGVTEGRGVEHLRGLWADLRKPRLEAYLTEVGFVIGEIDDAFEHLEKWMRPERKHTSLLAHPGVPGRPTTLWAGCSSSAPGTIRSTCSWRLWWVRWPEAMRGDGSHRLSANRCCKPRNGIRFDSATTNVGQAIPSPLTHRSVTWWEVPHVVRDRGAGTGDGGATDLANMVRPQRG